MSASPVHCQVCDRTLAPDAPAFHGTIVCFACLADIRDWLHRGSEFAARLAAQGVPHDVIWRMLTQRLEQHSPSPP